MGALGRVRGDRRRTPGNVGKGRLPGHGIIACRRRPACDFAGFLVGPALGRQVYKQGRGSGLARRSIRNLACIVIVGFCLAGLQQTVGKAGGATAGLRAA